MSNSIGMISTTSEKERIVLTPMDIHLLGDGLTAVFPSSISDNLRWELSSETTSLFESIPFIFSESSRHAMEIPSCVKPFTISTICRLS